MYKKKRDEIIYIYIYIYIFQGKKLNTGQNMIERFR